MSARGLAQALLKATSVLVAGVLVAFAGPLDSSANNATPRSVLPALLRGMQPMKLRVVRSAELGCEPACAEWISAEGDIVETTPAQFQRLLDSLGGRKLPVFINSGGGSIEAAMAVGRLLRSRQLDVSVTRTDFTACTTTKIDCAAGASPEAAKALRGLPNSFSAYCASACTLVLAAGTERLASPWSHVGVHSIIVFKTQYRVRRTFRVTTLPRPGGGVTTRRTLLSEQTIGASTSEVAVNDTTYRPMEAYLRQMGIDQSLVPMMEATPNSDIHWMTRAEQVATSLTTRQDSGDALLKTLDVLPLSTAEIVTTGADPRHTHAVIPVFYQGRSIALQFEAVYDKAKGEISLSVAPRHGSEVLRSQDLEVTFGLGGDFKVVGSNGDKQLPYAPLTVMLPPAQVCSLRQSGAVQISLRPAVPQDAQTVPLGQTRPVTMTLAFVPGLTGMLAEACGTMTATGN